MSEVSLDSLGDVESIGLFPIEQDQMVSWNGREVRLLDEEIDPRSLDIFSLLGTEAILARFGKDACLAMNSPPDKAAMLFDGDYNENDGFSVKVGLHFTWENHPDNACQTDPRGDVSIADFDSRDRASNN